MMHAIHIRQMDRYFSGTLRPPAVADMFERLWRCAACRVHYERQLLLERALPDGGARGQDRLWRSIVASAEAGARSQPAPGARGRLFRPAALVAVSALAAALLFAARPVQVATSSTPVARGPISAKVGPPSLHLFRSAGEHQTQPVERTMRADDGILIAYSNPGAIFSYLMVFAVDVRGGVHWYYPAYEQPGQNPAAPAIRKRALGVELGEEIRHPLPPGPLRIFALFLARPLRVDQIERVVSNSWTSHGQSVVGLSTLPVQDGEQVSRLLEVTP